MIHLTYMAPAFTMLHTFFDAKYDLAKAEQLNKEIEANAQI
jgi:hypothetical protein